MAYLRAIIQLPLPSMNTALNWTGLMEKSPAKKAVCTTKN
jgi:hypothetical protein